MTGDIMKKTLLTVGAGFVGLAFWVAIGAFALGFFDAPKPHRHIRKSDCYVYHTITGEEDEHCNWQIWYSK